MEDYSKMYPFINNVAGVWIKYLPYLRFGQMMIIFLEDYEKRTGHDAWFLKEDEFFDEFKDFAKRYGRAQ